MRLLPLVAVVGSLAALVACGGEDSPEQGISGSGGQRSGGQAGQAGQAGAAGFDSKPSPVAEFLGQPSGLEWFGVHEETLVWSVSNATSGHDVRMMHVGGQSSLVFSEPTGDGGSGVWINGTSIVWEGRDAGKPVIRVFDRSTQQASTHQGAIEEYAGKTEWIARRRISTNLDSVTRHAMDGTVLGEVKIDIFMKGITLRMWTDQGLVGTYELNTVLFPWDGSPTKVLSATAFPVPYESGFLMWDGSVWSEGPALGAYKGGQGGAPVIHDFLFYCDSGNACRYQSLAPATRGDSKVILKEFDNVTHLQADGDYLYFGTADSIWRVHYKALVVGLP